MLARTHCFDVLKVYRTQLRLVSSVISSVGRSMITVRVHRPLDVENVGMRQAPSFSAN